MNEIKTYVTAYLDYCKNQKCLDEKTLKAYKIDLSQFYDQISCTHIAELTPAVLEDIITKLHRDYKPKTVKRKIASLKAFFNYLQYKDIIEKNPFDKVQVKFRSPTVLPKTIPLHTVEAFMTTIYMQLNEAKTEYQKNNTIRDAAVIELLFATGMRISELCELSVSSVDIDDRTILIFGKGSKERMIQIGSDEVINILKRYKAVFEKQIQKSGYFFVNKNSTPMSDQSVRRLINKYADMAGISQHITPHMFRHTFATSLLENDVDIRYIQEMLGHSSINTTEIYTHVSTSKQRKILETKHPRKNFNLGNKKIIQ